MNNPLPPPVPETCASCRHSLSNPDDLGRTHMCRRYPPTVFPVDHGGGRVGSMQLFPVVRPEATCGEYTSRGVLSINSRMAQADVMAEMFQAIAIQLGMLTEMQPPVKQ